MNNRPKLQSKTMPRCVEEAYFSRNGITDWGIVTPGEIDKSYLKNTPLFRADYKGSIESSLSTLTNHLSGLLAGYVQRFMKAGARVKRAQEPPLLPSQLKARVSHHRSKLEGPR